MFIDPSILVNNITFAEEDKQIVPDQTAPGSLIWDYFACTCFLLSSLALVPNM